MVNPSVPLPAFGAFGEEGGGAEGVPGAIPVLLLG